MNETTSDSPKLVPESDLLAVKKGSEEKISKLTADIAEASRKSDEHYQNLLNERASAEAVKLELEQLKATSKDVAEIQAKLDALRNQSVQDSTRSLELHRQLLVLKYSIGKELVDGKTQQQLDSLEEALKIIGPVKKSSGIDHGGNTGVTSGSLSSREKIAAGLAQKFKK